ncbi:MAG: glycosyltransferase [Acidobacteriaceae bacterium]|nr:glycosyltransferase [Acidobacteriaceae bacterium]
MPFQVGYYQNQEFATKLQELLPAHDGVLAHLIRTGSYLSDCKLPKVLEMTDAISLTYSRGSRLTQNGIVSALAYRWEARRLIRYERSIVDHFDLSILVSRVDRDFLLRPDSSASVYVCPNGVDASALPFQYRPDGATIIFIGNNTALHNVDGILYFVEEILPRVRSRNPRAQFKVIGRISDRLRRRLQREAKVIVTGSVQSVADEARSASVAVCPIRFGAGVQNKLLEYLSLGIPAVTSAIGQEGLAARDQVHLLLAETQDEWVDRVCELLQNPERGCALAHAGRALVEGEYSWSKLVEPLRRRIFDLVDSRFGKTSAKSILEHTTPSI